MNKEESVQEELLDYEVPNLFEDALDDDVQPEVSIMVMELIMKLISFAKIRSILLIMWMRFNVLNPSKIINKKL